MTEQGKPITEQPSLEAQERLAEIMNDSSRKTRLGGTEWEIKALKPGTQYLIAQEVTAMSKKETNAFGDVVKEFASNIPSVVKCITLALLNDRRRIFKNGKSGDFSEEYENTYDNIMWNTRQDGWLTLLVEVLQMLEVDFFFESTACLKIFQSRSLERKMTMEEQRLSLHAQNGGR